MHRLRPPRECMIKGRCCLKDFLACQVESATERDVHQLGVGVGPPCANGAIQIPTFRMKLPENLGLAGWVRHGRHRFWFGWGWIMRADMLHLF